MNSRAWMLFGALFASVAGAQSPATATATAAESSTPEPANASGLAIHAKSTAPAFVVLDAETSRTLRQFAARHYEGATLPDRDLDRTKSKLALISIRPERRPHTLGCDDFDCYTFDHDGSRIEKIAREKIYASYEDDSAAGLSCLGSNNLLSTFERDAHCRGFGKALINPFRPVETAADLDR